MRSCLAGLLLLAACGGEADSNREEPDGRAPLGGSASADAGSAGQPSPIGGNESSAGHGGTQAAMGAAGASGGSAGETTTGGQGAATAGGMSSGGAAAGSGDTAAGTSGMSGAASGGGESSSGGSAGAGGNASDLDPKPVPGCEGYLSVVIPHATCVWFHGAFAFQNKECNIANPVMRPCAVVSAPGAETTAIVSADARIDRFAFIESGCPQSCQ